MPYSDSTESVELSSQVRTNALISYFFLGALLLLAKRNPNFSHPFVREHAWAATRIHSILLGFSILYLQLLADLLSYRLPIIDIPLSRVVFSVVLFFLLALLFRGAYLAHQGKKYQSMNLTLSEKDLSRVDYAKLEGEADLIRTMISFFPLIGVFVAERYPSTLTQIGAKISGYSTFLFIIEFIFLRGESLLMVTLFFLIILIVTTGVLLASQKSVDFLASVQLLPGIREIQVYSKVIPLYLADIFLVVIGRKNEIGFMQKCREINLKIENTEKQLSEYFTDASLVFSPYIIYIPLLNLLLLYRFFSPQKSRYALAINQGIMLSFLVIGVFILGYFDFLSYTLVLFALLPIMLGIATIKQKPFLQIPILYEIGTFISYVSFGIISGTKSTRERSKEVREVSFKVE
ncbi:MAG: hypothetical protein PHU93_00205 [Candidatus Gracilibacteria bacterium]|nr:hypothetical protein [Candidatus Gracilibacteria bacterium]